MLLGANPFADDRSEEPDEAAEGQRFHERRKFYEQRRYGLAPTDPVPAVLPGPQPDSRQLDLLTWGLVPAWADPSTGTRRINARAETVCEKASFRRAVRSRRALLPADGWYEWVRSADGARLPHLVQPEDGGLLAFAGLFERWSPPGTATAPPLLTCAILTGPAPEALAWLHERAPLVVPSELWADWLDPNSDAEPLLEAVLAAQTRPMAVRRVSTAVNSVRNTGPALVEPVADTTGKQVSLW